MFFFLISVLIGTVYPIFRSFNNTKISVGPPFYNLVIFPFIIPFFSIHVIWTKYKWIKNKYSRILKLFLIILFASIINYFNYFFFLNTALFQILVIISQFF